MLTARPAAGGTAGRPRAVRAPTSGGTQPVGLSGGALCGQLVELALLVLERLLRLGERGDGGLLAGFRGGDGLLGVLLGEPSGGLLVDLLGAGGLKVGDHLL